MTSQRSTRTGAAAPLPSVFRLGSAFRIASAFSIALAFSPPLAAQDSDPPPGAASDPEPPPPAAAEAPSAAAPLEQEPSWDDDSPFEQRGPAASAGDGVEDTGLVEDEQTEERSRS